MPRKYFYYRLRTLLSISLIWVVCSIVFFENLIRPGNDLAVKVSFGQFALTFGISGFLITGALLFVLKQAFLDKPLWLSTLIKMILTLLLYFLLAFVFLMIYYVSLYHGSLEDYNRSFFNNIVYTRTFLVFMMDMGVMTFISIIYLEVSDKYGPGMFWSMIIGEYQRPRIENRIFIFLDINESTTIAEQLGHERYFMLLRRFYADLTIPILANEGRIYQYVGDEIVLSWPNTPDNKIKSLKFIRNAYYFMERNSRIYKQRYGKVPRFKAGVHAGEVTAGFIGLLKRDLIYSGDTVNTTARIRSMCHELNELFVISEDFMQDFYQPHGYEITEIGSMELKGRSEPAKLFSLKFD